ncbi:pentatricopeptide repeat-containing protein At4g13650-like isoform X2 [Magnolia sinica]|uniref:pentatricopeptide repeat-containing protein At4g13650-like isoform X2 n=1 Tax=Magnolia sinica TaxID=86752 RepID=UPI00265B68CA|nr:pentatricopeptide repeat-containing protein At4g13650-like isoform X2 [Magnolia sinica]
MLEQLSALHLRRTSAVAAAKINPLLFAAASKLSNCPQPDSLPRNHRVAASSENESNLNALQMFAEMPRIGPSRNPCHFSILLSACAKSASLSAGEQAHSVVLKLGFDSNVFIGSALVNLYCKCSRISDARLLFNEMPQRNVVTWNSIICGYSQTQFPDTAFEIFVAMLGQGIYPTPFTFSSVLVACSRLEICKPGIQIHCLVLKFGFCWNVVVVTALMDMYSKCSSLDDSRRVFNEMPERNVVTWTSMVTGYAQHHRPGEAMVLVREMQRLGVKLNKLTYNSLLSSFSSSKDLDNGKQVHGQVIREGLESDEYLVVTLITMYSKCESIEDFYKIWPTASAEDQISCNSIIAGFSHLGDGQEVLERFAKMRQGCIDMDYFTFASVLRAIGILSALEDGKQTHALILKTGYASNVTVENGLVSMYARCGAIDDSRQVFLSMNEPDLVSWNSLLAGCSQHGYGSEAVELFEEMRRLRIRPDHTTFLSVLSACSHVGLLEKGLEYFDLMRRGDSMAAPRAEHYACVVDLLGRAGHLVEAESFVDSMPIKPGASVYRALLSACRVHGSLDIAVVVGMMRLECGS